MISNAAPYSTQTEFPQKWPWYAVRVKPHFEQATASCLAAKGYEQYLPAYRVKRRWSDRIKELDVPLFPGYVFSRFNASKRVPVLNSPGVLGVVSFGRELVPIEDREIENIRSVLNSKLGVQPWPFLESGCKVELQDGPLRGVEGVVIEVKGACRLIVSVTLLQRSISVEVDREWVRMSSSRPSRYAAAGSAPFRAA